VQALLQQVPLTARAVQVVAAGGEGAAPAEVIARQCALLRGAVPILSPADTKGQESVDGSMTDWALDQVHAAPSLSMLAACCIFSAASSLLHLLCCLFFAASALMPLLCCICFAASALLHLLCRAATAHTGRLVSHTLPACVAQLPACAHWPLPSGRCLALDGAAGGGAGCGSQLHGRLRSHLQGSSSSGAHWQCDHPAARGRQ
jgi:hypothetical protein